ncbi:MAG: sigma 54-interacting transcriptional regulator [Candidatus Aureabacteria bacterium]|nr:sigma 54-interacting transcriptional regulator [Candidatus Auribacterota bacterium]
MDIQKKINNLKLVHYIAVEMNKAHTTRELLEIILERCIGLTNATTGTVMLIDHEKAVLDILAYKGIRPNVADTTKLKIGEGVTGWVAKTGIPKLLNDIRKEPRYVSIRKDLMSELAVPIKTDAMLIGVISVDSSMVNAFSEDHLELLTMVAELSAQIILREKTQESLESKVNTQDVLISAFDILEKENDLNSVFNQIMEVLKNKMLIIRGMLVLFDKDDPGSLNINCGYRISDEAMKKGIYKIGEGIIGGTVESGKTTSIRDVSKEPRFLNKMKLKRAGLGRVSFIASPIKIDHDVIGVLAIESRFESDRYFEDVTKTMTLLTSMISYRVRNHQLQEEETRRLITENLELREELKTGYSFRNIIGRNENLRKVIEQVKTIANTPASVLITGETGTGKELIAKVLHFLSDRRDKRFVSLNCAAIPENLLESELFGYKKGAFTSAVSNRTGKFELASGGTLFLDEIGDMPVHLQAKILRAIQEKEIEPLGSDETVKIDIRIITATNKNLEKMVHENKFRSDLFFRLNVITLRLPPLRERKDDIMLLVDYFIKKYNALYHKNVTGLDPKIKNILLNYNWPGNIRELENIIEKGVVLSRKDVIDKSVLPDQMLHHETGHDHEKFDIEKWISIESKRYSHSDIYSGVIGRIEKILIEKLLVQTNYNKSRTASILGINRNTLKAKIREYNLL